MQFDVIYVAGIISAVSAILGSAWKIIKAFNAVLDKIEGYDEAIKEMNLNLLRLTLLNSSLPLEERIAAGDKYIAKGGNGYGHRVYDELLQEVKIDNERVN